MLKKIHPNNLILDKNEFILLTKRKIVVTTFL